MPPNAFSITRASPTWSPGPSAAQGFLDWVQGPKEIIWAQNRQSAGIPAQGFRGRPTGPRIEEMNTAYGS